MTAQAEATAVRPSAWAPMREAGFRVTWTVFLGAQIATWAQTVGAVDLIEARSDSAAALAAVQAAISLPGVVLALLAGTIADRLDRRRLLAASCALMTVAIVLLAASAAVASPAVVIVLTGLLGVGLALLIPTFIAMTPDLVPRDLLVPAVSISGVSVNLARAVGPALAGAVIAVVGAGGLFWVLAGVLVAATGLLALRGPRSAPPPPPADGIGAAVVTGVRYVRHATGLRRVTVRTALFVFPASALWAMLPVIAVKRLEMGGSGYGALMGCVGCGAVVAALLIPWLGVRLSLDALASVGSALLVAVLAALAVLHSPAAAAAVLVLAGVAWILVLTAMNTAAHTVTHDWIRGRAMAVWLVAYQAGLSIGAIAWGVVADVDLEAALLVPAAALLAGAAAARLLPLPPGDDEVGLDPAAT